MTRVSTCLCYFYKGKRVQTPSCKYDHARDTEKPNQRKKEIAQVLGSLNKKKREKKTVSPEDQGNAELLGDIEDLLDDAKDKQFHDRYSSLTFPKSALIDRLKTIIERVRTGKYDN